MAEYVTHVDDNLLAAVKDEIARKEEQQQRHYMLLSELQTMARELPGKYQQRLPYDLLCGLANSLLDGTVIEIVRSLKEVQQLAEKNLYSQRNRLITDQKTQRAEMLRKQREAVQLNQSKPHQLPYIQNQNEKELESFERSCAEDIKRRDMKIILELDQQVMDQQVTLERVGIPGFFVTNSPQEVRLQMYLLDFIIRLGQLETNR